ncbi:hypothetical protein M2G70_23375 [Vibrio vulnificus]|nr:hypothetical protein [Vibrio vulnificus]
MLKVVYGRLVWAALTP